MALTSVTGGLAMKKQQRVKIRYVATFMKTSKMTDPLGSWYRAPVLKALEKVALCRGENVNRLRRTRNTYQTMVIRKKAETLPR